MDIFVLMDYVQHYTSPLGGITLSSDGEALTGLWFDGQKHFGSVLGPECLEADLPVFGQARRWLDVYFSGWEPDFTPPLRLIGTPFQKAVWEVLRTIPYGRTATYGEIAARVGAGSATGAGPSCRALARAVGSAVGRNPVSLIVPCHRVMGAGGRLTGYAAGLPTKSFLLHLESR